MDTLSPSPLSVALIFGLYRPSSGPIAFNVLKCSTRHTFFTIRFWHFSSAAFIEKTAERVPMLVIVICIIIQVFCVSQERSLRGHMRFSIMRAIKKPVHRLESSY